MIIESIAGEGVRLVPTMIGVDWFVDVLLSFFIVILLVTQLRMVDFLSEVMAAAGSFKQHIK